MLYPLDEMMKAVKLAEGIVQAEINEKESHYDTDNEHEDESASERGFGDNGGGRRVSDGAFVFDNGNRYVENYNCNMGLECETFFSCWESKFGAFLF